MMCLTILRRASIAGVLLAAGAARAGAQTAPQPYGRVSFLVNSAQRQFEGGTDTNDLELSTAVTLRLPEFDGKGVEYGVDLRHSHYTDGNRSRRISIYDAFAGVRFGESGQVRVRAGHMWLNDIGTAGSLAGAVVEYRQPGSSEAFRVRGGAFGGIEPLVYDTGYAPHVKKYGGYVALEKGYLQRHVVGYTQVRNGAVTERSVLSVTNFVPAGRRFFAYQTAEFDVNGAANGVGPRGLNYFLANVRVNPVSRVELLGTYNRGRSLDARTLTDDVINARPLTSQAVEGLRYESRGGRVTVEVVRNLRVYAGYSQDRNNRDDAATGRTTLGMYAGNLFRTGFDVAASDSLFDRPSGPYHSRYFSIGHAIGRMVYVSGDYSTSLSVVRFLRSDGLVIETRPWSRRVSGNMSATLNRHFSLLCSGDYIQDEALNEMRILSGLSYRFR